MSWHDIAVRFASYAPFYLLAIIIAWFWYLDKMPTMDQLTKTCELLSTRGGNIAILLSFSLIGLKATMELFYYTLEQVQHGTLQENNAYALMALQFCTTSLFAGSFGAMLKTMDSGGDQSKPPVTPTPTITTPTSGGPVE